MPQLLETQAESQKTNESSRLQSTATGSRLSVCERLLVFEGGGTD